MAGNAIGIVAHTQSPPSPLSASPGARPGPLATLASFLTGRRWALAFALAVMILTSLPVFLGFSAQGESWRFTGFLFAVEDGNSYIAKMMAGSAGEWLFRSPYTAVHQRGVLALLPYLLLGKLVAPPGAHEQLVVIFHLFRIAAGMLVLLATYDFLAFFLCDERLRRWSLAMAALGGGLGWLVLLFGQDTWYGSIPLEFYSPEAFGLLALFTIPHVAAARAAMLWGLLTYLENSNIEGPIRWRPALKMGLCWLMAAIFQPLTALVMGCVIFAHLVALGLGNVWRGYRSTAASADWPAWRRCVRFAIVAFLIPAPYLIYYALTFSLDPYLRTWTAQNMILSPPFPLYLLAYAVLLPLLPTGIRNILKSFPVAGWLPVAWLAAFPLLAYAPVNLQRRLVEGIWLVLIVLASSAVRAEDRNGVSYRSFQAVSLLVFPSTILMLILFFVAAMKPALPLFHPAEEVEAFEWLSENAPTGSVVFSGYDSANALPAWAPVRTLIGHGPESAGLEALQPRVEGFFNSGITNAERRQLLDEFGVSYLFYGPAEQALGDWEPLSAGYLEQRYEQGDYQIFQVNP